MNDFLIAHLDVELREFLFGLNRRIAALENDSVLGGTKFHPARKHNLELVEFLNAICDKLTALENDQTITPIQFNPYSFYDPRSVSFINGLADRITNLSQEEEAYVAVAVHFDGTQTLHRDAISCPLTNGKFSFSIWYKDIASDDSVWGLNNSSGVATLIPVRNAGSNEGFNFKLLKTVGNRMTVHCPSRGTDGAWHHILGSLDAEFGEGLKLGKLYLDDVDVTSITHDSGDAFTRDFDGQPFDFGTDGEVVKTIGDYADVWIAPGVSLLVDGDIPEATRRLFISAEGKPVNPTGFPSGTIRFSGDAEGFIENQGTGGSFVHTGPDLTNASSSPSD